MQYVILSPLLGKDVRYTHIPVDGVFWFGGSCVHNAATYSE